MNKHLFKKHLLNERKKNNFPKGLLYLPLIFFLMSTGAHALTAPPGSTDVEICRGGIEIDQPYTNTTTNTVTLGFSYEGAIGGGSATLKRDATTVTSTVATYKMPPNCSIQDGCWPDGTTASGETTCEVSVTFERGINVTLTGGSSAVRVNGSTYSAKAKLPFTMHLPRRCNLENTSRALNNEHNRLSGLLCEQANLVLQSALKIRSTCPNPRIDTNACTRRCCNKMLDRRVPPYYRVLKSTESEMRANCTVAAKSISNDTLVIEDCTQQCITNTKRRGSTCPDESNPLRRYCGNDDSDPSCKYYPIPN